MTMAMPSIMTLRRMGAMGPRDFFCRSCCRSGWSSGRGSCSFQIAFRLSNSIYSLLCHFTKFILDAIHFHPKVVLGDPQDLFHFLLALVFQVEHGQRLLQSCEAIDGGV